MLYNVNCMYGLLTGPLYITLTDSFTDGADELGQVIMVDQSLVMGHI